MTATSRPNVHPLVTIGISTYNRVAGTFPQSLASALAQTYPQVEVVVCDNASTDGTEEYMLAQRDERLRYHRNPRNIGPNANFNACLALARGQYFLLLHDDDLLEPTFVERAVGALAGRDTGVMLGGLRLIDGDGRVLGLVPPPPDALGAAELFLDWFNRRFSFYFCSTLFHTDRLRQLGGFASPSEMFQDVVAIVRLVSRFGYVAVPGIGASFRKHGNNYGGGGHAGRWTIDAEYLLDLLCEELPDDVTRLRNAGAPYLSNTCYRYVAAEPSWRERKRLYHDIYQRFGRTLPPWRFRIRTQRQRLREGLGRWLRAVGIIGGRGA